jgi:hypothetical protein
MENSQTTRQSDKIIQGPTNAFRIAALVILLYWLSKRRNDVERERLLPDSPIVWIIFCRVGAKVSTR